jgi:hypothetical protein
MDTISNQDDLINIRDVIARVEELEDEKEDQGVLGEEDSMLLADLLAFLNEMAGNGADEEWRGDWYPITAIRESYFEQYAQELAEDLDLIHHDAKWPYTCIDWEKAAAELQYDYTSAEFDGVTYYFR